MQLALTRFAAIACLLCLLWAAAPAFSSIPSREILGIAPLDEGYYSSSVIKCKDGSKKFTKEQLNDEFCDCPDGTDEPGTSACPGGKFYCRNSGHTPIWIFSSRVNDGLCDCCDGSDEYNGQIKCPNTCWEAGKVAREKLRKKISTYQEGVSIRKQEIKKAEEAFAKDEAELSKLKSEENILKGLVQKLKEHKEQIEKAEEEERLKREKEEQKQQELEKKEKDNDKEKLEEKLDDNTKEITEIQKEAAEQDDSNDEKYISETEDEDPDSEHRFSSDHGNNQRVEEEDSTVEPKNVDAAAEDTETFVSEGSKEEQVASVGTEKLSKEELGRLVASRWTGETSDHKPDVVDETVKKEESNSESDASENTEGDELDGYNSEAEEKYEDDDEYEDHSDSTYEGDSFEPRHDHEVEPEHDDSTDLSSSNTPSWLHKIQQHVHNFFNSINLFKNPVNISEAANVRKEYDDASSRLSKMQSRISSLTEKFKQDFGPEKEFYSFYDHCFEYKESKYVYKVCPYKQASQVEGYSTTRLGNWENFEESYRIMRFGNGDRCWNGPDRSIKVRLRCGVKNELADVDEPSRCEYVALLSTPAVCTEEKLKELEQKLQRMTSGQHITHDEL